MHDCNSYTISTYTGPAPADTTVCPNCGRCPTCGQYRFAPAYGPIYPTYPSTPVPWPYTWPQVIC